MLVLLGQVWIYELPPVRRPGAAGSTVHPMISWSGGSKGERSDGGPGAVPQQPATRPSLWSIGSRWLLWPHTPAARIVGPGVPSPVSIPVWGTSSGNRAPQGRDCWPGGLCSTGSSQAHGSLETHGTEPGSSTHPALDNQHLPTTLGTFFF